MNIDALKLGQTGEPQGIAVTPQQGLPKQLPVSVGDVVRIESVVYAHEGVVFSVNADYIELNPAVRNTDMVRLHKHLTGVVNESQTENEECPYGVKIACQAITCILPMDTPAGGFVTIRP